MALTGFTRNGHCVDTFDDAGSHHVCIDMGSKSERNFCQVTGQPNWCENQMPCDVGVSADAGWSKASPGDCPVRQWCVCQWAFASYVHNAGGCDKIKSFVCEATNAEVVLAYHEQAPKDPQVADALRCLEQRCGISPLANATAALTRDVSRERKERVKAVAQTQGGAKVSLLPLSMPFLVLVLALTAAAAGLILSRAQRRFARSEGAAEGEEKELKAPPTPVQSPCV